MTQRGNKWVYFYENTCCFEKELQIKGHESLEPGADSLQHPRGCWNCDLGPLAWAGSPQSLSLWSLFKLYDIIQLTLAIFPNIPFTQQHTV